MAFKFSLAPVLEQRLAVEDRAQRDYNAALGRLRAAQHQRETIAEEVAARRTQARDGQCLGKPFLYRVLIEDWISALERQLPGLELEINRLTAQAEQLRLKLVRAMQERSVMDKLQEQEMREHKAAEERRERLQFDEIAIRDFAMNQREKNAGYDRTAPATTAA